MPQQTTWKTSAGGLSSSTGSEISFFAPSNAADAKITVTVGGVSKSIVFKVVEPDGYASAFVTSTNHYPVGVSAAGMTLRVAFAPTSVSFYRVSVMEVGEDASDISGYFTYWTPQQNHHSSADHWTPLNSNNRYEDDAAIGAPGFPNPPAWSSGRFTWNIPAKWQIAGSGATNSMRGWNQIISIDSSGTVKITKFGYTVTRNINDVTDVRKEQ
jgi:hypothetical protein